MPTPRVTIDALPEQATPEDTNFLVVQDDDTTKKMSIATLKTLESTALAAHLSDTSDAHDASAISTTDSGSGIDSTTVQGQLGQLAGVAGSATTNLAAHLVDTTAHTAAAIVADPHPGVTATDVQGQLEELSTALAVKDVMWVGPNAPSDPVVEMWYDPDEPAPDLGVVLPFIDVRDHGAVGDGVADDHAALVAAFTTAADTGQTVLLPAGTYRDTTGRIDITDSVSIKADPGATLHKDHATYALYINPPAVAGGVVTASVAGATTLTVTGATWTVNEHVGKWAHVAAAFPEARKVLSNTADTLTLDYALGNSAAAGVALTFFTAITVDIDGLTIEGQNTGTDSANVVIQYGSRVRLNNVTSNRCGGNAMSIYWSENVDVNRYHCDGAKFGMFVYGSRVGSIVDSMFRNWSDEYGVQAKDCVGFDIVRPYSNPGSAGGDVGSNIKASGLNPSRDCRIIHPKATGCGSFGAYLHSLANEGTGYVAENFELVGGQFRSCISDWGVVASSGGSFTNARVIGPVGVGARGAGWNVNANDVVVDGFYNETSDLRSGTVTGFRNRVRGTIRNPLINTGASADAAVRLDGCNDSQVDFTIIKDSALSRINRGVREINTAVNNEIRRDIRDTAGTALVGDVLLLAGSASRVLRRPGWDVLVASTIDASVDESKRPIVINTQTGTTYTLVLADAGKLVTLSNAAAITLTVPTNATVPYPVGTTIDLIQLGAGQVTVAAAGGVTVTGTPGLKLRAQNASGALVKIGTDAWVLTGDLAA